MRRRGFTLKEATILIVPVAVRGGKKRRGAITTSSISACGTNDSAKRRDRTPTPCDQGGFTYILVNTEKKKERDGKRSTTTEQRPQKKGTKHISSSSNGKRKSPSRTPLATANEEGGRMGKKEHRLADPTLKSPASLLPI